MSLRNIVSGVERTVFCGSERKKEEWGFRICRKMQGDLPLRKVTGVTQGHQNMI